MMLGLTNDPDIGGLRRGGACVRHVPFALHPHRARLRHDGEVSHGRRRRRRTRGGVHERRRVRGLRGHVRVVRLRPAGPRSIRSLATPFLAQLEVRPRGKIRLFIQSVNDKKKKIGQSC